MMTFEEANKLGMNVKEYCMYEKIYGSDCGHTSSYVAYFVMNWERARKKLNKNAVG